MSISTLASPLVPRHIAVIMDGNGRWARRRFLPRVAGHKAGVESVRSVVAACVEEGVAFLTLFAFSSENWRRPAEEVSVLMGLFIGALEREASKLHQNGVRLRVCGDLRPFEPRLKNLIADAEAMTASNTGLNLTICANYGGRWDITQATHQLLAKFPEKAQSFQPQDIEPYLSLAFAPEPDLFIRTGGEQRISNFMLWQLAYSELYFTDVFWPDFNKAHLAAAIASYQSRERRFGRTSEQVQAAKKLSQQTSPPH